MYESVGTLPLCHLRDLLGPECEHPNRGSNSQPLCAAPAPLTTRTHRKPRPNPRVYVMPRLNIPLLISMPKERPMVDIRLRGEGPHVPFRVPGIDVCVKVDDGDGAVDLVEGL